MAARASPCICRGSDLRLPFECPADFVFHIPAMDLDGRVNSSYRMPGFLEDQRVRLLPALHGAAGRGGQGQPCLAADVLGR